MVLTTEKTSITSIFLFSSQGLCNSSEKRAHPLVQKSGTQAAPKVPWWEPSNEESCRVCPGVRKEGHFPGAETCSQPFVTTWKGAKLQVLASSSPITDALTPQDNCFDPLSILCGPGLSAAHYLTWSINSELDSSVQQARLLPPTGIL